MGERLPADLLAEDIQGLRKEVAAMREENAALRGDVAGLLETWRAAAGFLSFIKQVSMIVLAVGAMWTALKGLASLFHIKLGG